MIQLKDFKNLLLSEELKVGDTNKSGGRTTTVTDIDPETQSITWKINKEIDDNEVYDDMTKLIDKFSKVQLKDFHSRPKLIQLIKDLKSIRNKFKRTEIR